MTTAKFKEAYVNIAFMHQELGDVSDALHYFSKTLQLDFKIPFVQSVHSSRSHAVLRRVAFCGALKDYTTAINALNALCGSHHHHHHQLVVEPGPCFDVLSVHGTLQ